MKNPAVKKFEVYFQVEMLLSDEKSAEKEISALLTLASKSESSSVVHFDEMEVEEMIEEMDIN